MFPASSKSTSGGSTVAFPDVCKTPSPPAPFAPVPYPNSQYQENLKAANKVDAMTKAGNNNAQKKQKEAIDNLYKQSGITAASATQAVILGKTVHGNNSGDEAGSASGIKSSKTQNNTNRESRKYSTMSNVSKSAHDILKGIISNIRA